MANEDRKKVAKIINELDNLFETMRETDLPQRNDIKLKFRIRDALLNEGFSLDMANDIASNVDVMIEIEREFSDDDLSEIAKRYARYIAQFSDKLFAMQDSSGLTKKILENIKTKLIL